MKWRLLALGVGVSVATLGVALVAAEMAVRYRERHRDVVPGTMPTMFYRHARLHHALVRDYSYFGWAQIDSNGFRRTKAANAPPGRQPVILVLGSSTTFDPAVSGDLQAWPARVAARLREADTTFEGSVLNGGVSGYTVVDNLVRLETVLRDFQPDLLLLYEGHNDLFNTLAGSATQEKTRPDRAATFTPWTAWLEEHSLLYGKLAGRLKAIRFGGGGGSRATRDVAAWDSVVAAGASRFRRDLESFAAVARARGIPLVLSTLTHVSGADRTVAEAQIAKNWAHTLPGVPPEVVLKCYAMWNAQVVDVARRHGLPLIDGASSGVAGLELYADGDPVHFNDRGADRFGRFVAERLAQIVRASSRPR